MDSIQVLFALGLCRVVSPHVCSYGFLEFEKKRSSVTCWCTSQDMWSVLFTDHPCPPRSLPYAFGRWVTCQDVKKTHPASLIHRWMFPQRSPGTIRTVLGGYFGYLGRKENQDRFEKSGCTGHGKKTSQQTVARCRKMFNESLVTTIANSYPKAVKHSTSSVISGVFLCDFFTDDCLWCPWG